MTHVVLAWELGAGFGHLTPIGALGSEFRRWGDRVTAVVPHLDPARQILSPLGIEVVEMAPIAAPNRSFPISINYSANLLRNGFWDSKTVSQRLLNWHQLLNNLQPNLLICDHAPSALLASRPANYLRVAIGHGFTLPPLAEPMPELQPWFSLPTDRLMQKDREFVDVVNPILQEIGIAPLKTVASLFDGVERFLCIEPDLDHYPVRPGETYWGAIDPVSSLPMPAPFGEDESGVFIYMSATNRFLQLLAIALEKRGIPTLAYISGGKLPVSSGIRYLNNAVDLHTVARKCRAAIAHGGTLSASIFLRNQVKLLICPPDLEKAVLGTRLRERKLAYSANWFSPQGLSATQIDELLTPEAMPANLSAFARQQTTFRKTNPAIKIVEQCQAWLN